MKNRVIAFNGPPGSGKDYAAEYLQQYDPSKNTYHVRMKTKLYELVYAIYCNPMRTSFDTFFLLMTDRHRKDVPHKLFKGLSPRQALIHVSEDIIKPNFGKDYFGKYLAQEIEDTIKLVSPFVNGLTFVISDCGFIEELKPVCEVTDVTLVRLYREGCTFKNDSRTYLNPFDHDDINVVDVIDLVNDGSENFDRHLELIFNKGIR